MDLDTETQTYDQKSICVPAIGKLREALCICLTYGNGEYIQP